MQQLTCNYSAHVVEHYIGAPMSLVNELFPAGKIIIITDENLFRLYKESLAGLEVIVIAAGEDNKQQSSVERIILRLIELQADRNTCIVGMGGGMVTDIAGFVASIYKRGTRLGLIPTSLLGMADASIGGKNGINVSVYKNMVGTLYHPEWIIFDPAFLRTLPEVEWLNGFAEVIKHAVIQDAVFFDWLEATGPATIMTDETLWIALIEKNVQLKTAITTKDEKETGPRKLLNFGHSIGHAIENLEHIPHGHAVSIGMVAEAAIAERVNGLEHVALDRLIKVLKQFHLPIQLETDKNALWEIFLLDKKRDAAFIAFILLDSIGHARVTELPLSLMQQQLNLL